MSTISKIIVHPGVFHADDVCVVAWLRITGCDAPVERRNPTSEELADPNILVADVGGQHDPKLNNFDHHQRGGAGSRWDTEIPYAAFGLVYDKIQPTDTAVASRFEKLVVEPVDAADCGWFPDLSPDCTGWVEPGKGRKLPPDRPGRPMTFSNVISGFNPGPSGSASDRDAAFELATRFAQQVLENELRSCEEFVAALGVVLSAQTADNHRLMILEQFVPWGEHIFSRPDAEHLLYVVFPSERGGWLCQQIPKSPGSFEGRKPLPEAWAGLRGEELAKIAGLSAAGQATFCHPGRFICGGETRADALRLAALAVQAD